MGKDQKVIENITDELEIERYPKQKKKQKLKNQNFSSLSAQAVDHNQG